MQYSSSKKILQKRNYRILNFVFGKKLPNKLLIYNYMRVHITYIFNNKMIKYNIKLPLNL